MHASAPGRDGAEAGSELVPTGPGGRLHAPTRLGAGRAGGRGSRLFGPGPLDAGGRSGDGGGGGVLLGARDARERVLRQFPQPGRLGRRRLVAARSLGARSGLPLGPRLGGDRAWAALLRVLNAATSSFSRWIWSESEAAEAALSSASAAFCCVISSMWATAWLISSMPLACSPAADEISATVRGDLLGRLDDACPARRPPSAPASTPSATSASEELIRPVMSLAASLERCASVRTSRRDHGEALAGLARAGRLDGRVERQQVGLEGDVVDHGGDVGDLLARLLDAGHGVDRLGDDLAAVRGDLARRPGRGRDGLARRLGGGLHRGGELLGRGCRLLQRGGLLLGAARQVVGARIDLARRAGDVDEVVWIVETVSDRRSTVSFSALRVRRSAPGSWC